MRGFKKPVSCNAFALQGRKLKQDSARPSKILKGLQPVSVKSEREFNSAGFKSPAANPKQGF